MTPKLLNTTFVVVQLLSKFPVLRNVPWISLRTLLGILCVWFQMCMVGTNSLVLEKLCRFYVK